MSPVLNVLFLCTGNSARSIFAEVLLNHWGQGRFRAYSAGSQPVGVVNPLALDLLKQRGLSVEGLRSKSWDEFTGPTAPLMDFVITVCGGAAEVCPLWPQRTLTAHWGVADPAAVTGHEAEKRHAFEDAFQVLEHRIRAFVDLPLPSLDPVALRKELNRLGHLVPTFVQEAV